MKAKPSRGLESLCLEEWEIAVGTLIALRERPPFLGHAFHWSLVGFWLLILWALGFIFPGYGVKVCVLGGFGGLQGFQKAPVRHSRRCLPVAQWNQVYLEASLVPNIPSRKKHAKNWGWWFSCFPPTLPILPLVGPVKKLSTSCLGQLSRIWRTMRSVGCPWGEWLGSLWEWLPFKGCF